MRFHRYIIVFVIFLFACLSTTPTNKPMSITDTYTSTFTQKATYTIKPSMTITNTKIIPTKKPSRTITETYTQTQLPSGRANYDKVSGSYGIDRSDGGYCRLLIVMEPRDEPFDKISFELFCIRGAPSYNSGYAMELIYLSNNIAVYTPSDKCNIVFQFYPASVYVTQIGLDFDCGFGHAVYADGSYSLLSRTIPRLGCMRLDNPCNL
jgi:hypothetical protein